MDNNNGRVFVELRFWNTRFTNSILDCLIRNYSLKLLRGRVSASDAWYRFELVGDARGIDALRSLGKQYGFYVGSAATAVA